MAVTLDGVGGAVGFNKKHPSAEGRRMLFDLVGQTLIDILLFSWYDFSNNLI
ncbi:hypothetical protein [Effusibacillus consociatus]|uniref:Uncharacterized protein n=1 Tax=Effusibacillus consociatus TaxID=1117041 RepID=A0ABV9Q6N7_9BACL